MPNILTMTEEEIIAAYSNPVDAKVTVTYANGYVDEIAVCPAKYAQEHAFWMHQQEVNPNIEDVR